MNENDIENEVQLNLAEMPLVIYPFTFELFLKCEDSSTCGMVYLFYYHTAKWQKTNQVWATAAYVQKKLNIGKIKFNRAKKQLIKHGLIEDIVKRDKHNRKIKKHYIKLNFIPKKEKIKKLFDEKNHTPENNPIDTKNHTPVFRPVDNQPTYALSKYILYALNNNKGNFEKLTIDSLDKLFVLSIEKLPKELHTKKLIHSMYEFFQYRKEIKKPIKTKIGVTKLTNELKQYTEDEIIKAIDTSIANSYIGIFPKKKQNGYTPNKKYSKYTALDETTKNSIKKRTIQI